MAILATHKAACCPNQIFNQAHKRGHQNRKVYGSNIRQHKRATRENKNNTTSSDYMFFSSLLDTVCEAREPSFYWFSKRKKKSLQLVEAGAAHRGYSQQPRLPRPWVSTFVSRRVIKGLVSRQYMYTSSLPNSAALLSELPIAHKPRSPAR